MISCFKVSFPAGLLLSRCLLVFTLFFISISLAFARNQDFTAGTRLKLSSLKGSRTILSGNSTILSENKTFELGFFSINDDSKWYLGIWYTSIPTPTYVWVANRENPIKNLSLARLEITEEDGKLALMEEEDSRTVLWETNNVKKGSEVKLLEQGNLVLFTNEGELIWQSFDYPTDTWLPGMNLTAQQQLTCWKSSTDPSPGRYSLRLRPPDYGEIALFYENGTSTNFNLPYWSTGNWTGNAFVGVPEMTIPYIYKFQFSQPFTPMASFGYSEISLENGLNPPLTRFHVDHMGQLKQYTWSPQTEYWNMFWSQPDNLCKVYNLCGNFGFCNSKLLSPCKCLKGFSPLDNISWNSGDFSGGCHRESGDICGKKDGFEEAGNVNFEGATTMSFSGTRNVCEKMCLRNCSCIGLYHNEETNLCKNLYGSLMNVKNVTYDGLSEENLFLRVPRSRSGDKKKIKLALIEAICGFLVILLVGLLVLFVLMRRRVRKSEKEEEEEVFPVTNLKVFSYKELHVATKGFSEKLGHGGFGAVFLGELSDSTLVAVKRLEKPGGGEKEFRAEVCTIGNIQHVNLVRLRGFCSENSHRLLVYDYMPNGPLSMYLKRDGKNLSWDVRFRVAIATARGIAYLHEECRNCIIHCDIKPENILLDEDFSAKVSDFGLAKLIGRDFSRVLATMRGTWGYVAPEWISGVAITTKADVYSYGMTLLELLGGRRNVEGPPSAGGSGGTEEKWFFPPWAAKEIIEGNVAAVIDERLGSLYNVAEAKRAGLIAIWCIQDDESMRPTMGLVVKMLEGVVEVTVPPPPKLLQALVSGESFHGVGINSDSRLSHGGSSDDNVQISMKSKGSSYG
ncbi:hypothetical protein M9H77_33227 [Catharanthus roseus]|uniref:Uncharacterized protein n=1 Tax=Catharanthus roseus TaxID=4058 RepID=A0ACB9ZLX1_CATRO|nr:hypothetical protein M9H77_33227 [Catharanthus roseus]